MCYVYIASHILIKQCEDKREAMLASLVSLYFRHHGYACINLFVYCKINNEDTGGIDNLFGAFLVDIQLFTRIPVYYKHFQMYR